VPRFEIAEDPDAVAARAAGLIAEAVERAPRPVLGLPAGRTPAATYRALGRLARERRLDLSAVQVVMMDEYVESPGTGGVAWVDERAGPSCRRYAERELRQVINGPLPPRHGIPAGGVHTPHPADPAGYDALIEGLGGIDLFLLAAGSGDGHVAFNPPGTAAGTRTRVVALADSTRRDNLRTFPSFARLDAVPTHGVTVGLATIAEARSVVLLLPGAEKGPIGRRIAGAHRFDPACPATVVWACAPTSSVLVLLDRGAAGAAGPVR
jgi:glucosamine-6-phosphate deaminase